MIITVTPNPALDITYTLDGLRLGESQRPTSERAVAGGKGVNVASVLREFGYAVAALGFVGGPTGEAFRADLAARGIDPAGFVPIAGATRRTVNLLADGVATMINEAGPDIDAGEWLRLEGAVADAVTTGAASDAVTTGAATDDALETIGRTRSTVLVVSGSLPRGVGEDGYARLVRVASRAGGRGVATIVDAGGPALAAACAAGPTLVKPNRAELAAATGRSDAARGPASATRADTAELLAGARQLRRLGAENVAVTDGAAGVLLLAADGTTYRAHLDVRLDGNPTGAGDAFAAAAATALQQGLDPRELLRRAVAWSAAAVLAPVAGEVEPRRAAELAAHVVVEEMS